MSRYEAKRALTLKELEEIIDTMDVDEEIDIAYIPPDVDSLTDEENIDDNEMGDTQNLPHDLAGTFDIMIPKSAERGLESDTEEANDANETIFNNNIQNLPIDVNIPGESASGTSSGVKKKVVKQASKASTEKQKVRPVIPPNKKRKHVHQKNEETPKVIWGKTSLDYERFPESTQEKDIKNISEKLHDKTPYEFFKLYFDEEVMQTIVDYSIKYGHTEKNNPDFTMNLDDLEIFLGILILSGYHTLPQVSMYWSTDTDKGVPIVKQSMSRNKFYSIKQ